MSVKIFIDGSSGTTGLRIADRLAQRPEIELLSISAEGRKDVNERAKVINSADLAFLCLPDAASKEVMPLLRPDVKVLDTSTAFRTDAAWDYGFPELKGQKEKIKNSCRVAVPGCYASGFNCLMYPMVRSGMLAPYHPVICHAISGYSGGGKKLIARYEDENRDFQLASTRAYSLGKTHKHVKEMMAVSGLSYPPVFCPIVGDFYNGMLVNIPIQLRTMARKVTAHDVWEMLSEHYAGEHFVQVMPFGAEGMPEASELFSNTVADTNMLRIFVYGNDDHVLLCSQLDNLGKGASGAAVQCMNIMMGIDERTGLE